MVAMAWTDDGRFLVTAHAGGLNALSVFQVMHEKLCTGSSCMCFWLLSQTGTQVSSCRCHSESQQLRGCRMQVGADNVLTQVVQCPVFFWPKVIILIS